MGCLRRKRFVNPIKPERRTGFDKYTIQGSCNCCAGCNKRKQNDWLVRGYFEYLSKETDGFFVSLDFDNDHIPIYDGERCFDSKLMSRFFESMRQRLPKFRYLYSSHYGEALERPHYHVIFLFDKDTVSFDTFWLAVKDLWHYGSHQDIQVLESVKGNPLSAIEYVCKYTTRDTRFLRKTKRLNFPLRYRPRTVASVGFGAQALDPTEFNSDRLKREGIIFRDTPVFTKDYLLNNSIVYLDIKRDGVLVPFAIPQYYYVKLGFDYRWDSELKKAEMIKNEFGRELQFLYYNADYVSLFSDIQLSRNLHIEEDIFTLDIFSKLYPDSPYLGMSWHDIVDDVMSDSEKFEIFCSKYPYIEFNCVPGSLGWQRFKPLRLSFDDNSYFYHHSACNKSCLSLLDNYLFDDVDLYIQAVTYFKLYKYIEDLRKAEFEDWKAQEQVKLKIKEKMKRDVEYYFHLKRAGFKFYKLNVSHYVSQYQINPN